MISVACSSFFQRTASSLVVSYLLILPLAMLGVMFWNAFGTDGQARLVAILTIVPMVCLGICAFLFVTTTARLLHPPDVGSEGKEVVDIENESHKAVGLIIQRDRFPDRLFAPAKRHTLLADGANPIFDKEMRSEIFAQGTLMLRLVIQMSMLLAIPLMAAHAVVHELYAGVQHARRPGILRRQRHQRARARDAGAFVNDDHLALANPLGQAALGVARVERADFVLALAALAGVHHGALFLEQPAFHPGLCRHRGHDLPDDRLRGALQLGILQEDRDQLNDDVPGDRAFILRSIGDEFFRQHVFHQFTRHSRDPQFDGYQPLRGGILRASGIQHARNGRPRGKLAARFQLLCFFCDNERLPDGSDDLVV
jgi:hypothetical protein